MAVAHAQKLLIKAQGGEKLTSGERRHVVEWLQATQPGLTNDTMADWFQVSDRTIRLDKKAIRLKKAKILKEDDPGLIIADISMAFDQQMQELEKGLSKTRLGSKEHLAYSIAIMDMHFKKLKAFQDAGYTPKNLGNMTVEKFEYTAIVHKDGSVETRKADMFKEKPEPDFIEAEVVPAPQLPAPSKETNEQNGEGQPELQAVAITCESGEGE